MNSLEGKRILALVREGDYAHAGEEEAIELVFSDLDKDPDREILDLGCGRGGTADYVQRHGWGRVTGVDSDAETLASAGNAYPWISFVVADAATVGQLWQSRFDLICLFNSFYAFPDQREALLSMRRAARPHAALVIFDYTDVAGTFRQHAGERESFWSPINLRTFHGELAEAGWELVRISDISAQYRTWYQRLCARFEAKKATVVGEFGQEWYDYAHAVYVDLLDLIDREIIGGAIVRARALSPDLP